MTNKIDLHTFIKKYRYSHPEFQDFDRDSISTSVFESSKSMFQKEQKESRHCTDIIEVCTTEVIPQHIKLGNDEIFVWDHAYWMLYRRFFCGSFCFHPNTSSIDDLSDFLSSIQYLFLSLRFTKQPAYAYYFAENFHKRNKMICHFRRYSNTEQEKLFKDNLGLELFNQLNRFAEEYVYLHEMQHSNYRNDNGYFLRDRRKVKDLFKKYDFGLSKIPEDDPTKRNYDDDWKTYHYYANIGDKNFEDICCDIFSIVYAVRSLVKQSEKEQSKEEIFKAYLSSIRYVIEMQNIFTQVEQQWKSVQYMFDDIKIGKEPDWEKFSSGDDRKYNIVSRNDAVYLFAAEILGIDFTSASAENELFDSDFYREASQKFFSEAFDNNTISVASVYTKQISEIFSPAQLLSARDLLIGWY